MRKRLAFILLAALAALAGPARAEGDLPVSLPVYGNWCGPGHPSAPWRAAPPVDPLDAACMRHDSCTAARGRFDCGCDLALMSELRNTPWPNPVIARNARAIHDAIAVTPCASPAGMAEKQSWLAGDLLDDMATGRGVPPEVAWRWMRLLGGF